MNTSTIDSIRQKLEEERAAITSQLQDHTREVGAGEEVETGSGDGFADPQATAGRSEILSLIEQLEESRNEIDGALSRIGEGTYGKCEKCGAEIPAERLEALPTARLCVSCKQSS
jgi:DnaK suppressor protein